MATTNKRTAKPRINLELPEDTYKELRAATVGGIEGVKISDFVREAIDEKLQIKQADPGLSALTHLYKQLTPDGQAWLIQCATIAADSDSARIIRQRKTNEDE